MDEKVNERKINILRIILKKILVVGNGILGMMSALKLKERSPKAEIAIIGKNNRPGGATTAAAAMLNSYAEIEPLSLKSLPSRIHFSLSRQATKEWDVFIEENLKSKNIPHSLRRRLKASYKKGTFIINNNASDSLDDKVFFSIKTALESYSEKYDDVEPAKIPNYFPQERLRAKRALFIPNEGWVNPNLILQLIELKLNKMGVTFIDEECVNVSFNANKVESIKLSNKKVLVGDAYLIANGSGFKRILSTEKTPLYFQPVFSGVGVSIQIRVPGRYHTHCVRTVNRGGACGIYTVPYVNENQNNSHQDIIIGASNFISESQKTRGRLISIKHLLDGAINEINQKFYNAELVKINVGNRPTTVDGYMLFGQTKIKNLFVITGTRRDGFHLAPVLAKNIAKQIFDDKIDPKLQVFHPNRKIIRDLSFKDGIDINTAHLISEQYQHGFIPATILQAKKNEETIRKEVEQIHNRAGKMKFGIQPLMLKMYRDRKIK